MKPPPIVSVRLPSADFAAVRIDEMTPEQIDEAFRVLGEDLWNMRYGARAQPNRVTE